MQKHEIQDVYLVANQPSSAEFLNVMGFEACADAPDELYTSGTFPQLVMHRRFVFNGENLCLI